MYCVLPSLDHPFTSPTPFFSLLMTVSSCIGSPDTKSICLNLHHNFIMELLMVFWWKGSSKVGMSATFEDFYYSWGRISRSNWETLTSALPYAFHLLLFTILFSSCVLPLPAQLSLCPTFLLHLFSQTLFKPIFISCFIFIKNMCS